MFKWLKNLFKEPESPKPTPDPEWTKVCYWCDAPDCRYCVPIPPGWNYVAIVPACDDCYAKVDERVKQEIDRWIAAGWYKEGGMVWSDEKKKWLFVPKNRATQDK